MILRRVIGRCNNPELDDGPLRLLYEFRDVTSVTVSGRKQVKDPISLRRNQ